jgi:tape measure domain-containing protein
MSKTVDERVVEMRFDNRNFESNVQTTMSTLDKLKKSLHLDGAAKGLEDINKASKSISLDSIASSVASLESRFSTLGIVGMSVVNRLTNSVMNLAGKTVSFLTNGVVQGGIGRAMKLEQAHFQLQGLLQDETAVEAVMKNVNDSVDGTAYSLDSAANVASQFAASGMRAGKEMFSALRGVAGVAAMTNSEYEDIGRIFTQVAGQGRLMGDQLLQLSARGINAAATLAKYMNKSEAEVRTMVTKGQVSFKTFAAAMDDAFGEHAKKANETVKGAMSNIKAALARIGAEFVSPLVVQNGVLVKLFNTLREKINDVKASIGPLANLFVKSVSTVTKALTNTIKGWDVKPFFEKFKAFSSSWDEFTEKINNAGIKTSDFTKKLSSVLKSHGVDVDKLTKKYGSITNAIKKGAVPVKYIVETLKKFTKVTSSASKTTDDITKKLKYFQEVTSKVWRGDYGNGEARIKALTKAGYDYAKVQALVNKTVGDKKHKLSIKDLTDVLGKMSDAELKSIGYTKEEVKQIKTLAAEAEKAGTPLNELINSLDKPSGTTLFTETLSNVVTAFKKVLETAKEAWNEIFPKKEGKDAADTIYRILEKLHDFSEKLIITDEAAGNLRDTLEGLFAVLDLSRWILTGTFGKLFKMACQLLEALDIDILKVTGSIGKAIVKFRDWVKSNSFMSKGIEVLASILKTSYSAIKRWIGEFLKIPKVQKVLSKLSSIFTKVLGGVKDKVTDGIKAIDKFIEKIKNMDKLSLEDVVKAFGRLKDKIVNYFKNLDFSFSGFSKAFEKVRVKAVSYLENVGLKLDNFKEKLIAVGQFIKDKLPAAIAIGMGVMMIKTINKLGTTLDILAAPFANITGILKDMAGSLKKFAKAAAFEATTRGVLNIAKAIAILAASVVVLSKMDQGKMWSAVGAISVLILALGGLSLAISKIQNIKDIAAIGTASLAFLSLAGAMAILVGCLKIMEGLDTKKAWTNVAILGAIATGLVALVGILGKFVPKLSKGSFAFLAIAGSLWILVDALVKLNDADLSNVKNNLTSFLGIVAMLGGLSLLCSKMSFGSALGMVVLALGLKLFIDVLDDVCKVDTKKIKKNLSSIIVIFGLFAAIMVASKFAGKNAASAGVGILALSLALLVIAKAIEKLGSMDESVIEKGVAVVSALMLVFGAIIALSKFAGKNAIKAGVMLLMMSGALLVLTGVIAILAQIKPDGLKQAVAAISVLEGLFAGLIAVSKLSKDCKATLIILTAAIVMLSVALIALSQLDQSALSSATAALTSVIGVFSLLIAATSLINGQDWGKKLAILAVLTLIVAALGLALVGLSKLNPGPTLEIAASMSLVLLALATSCAILNFVSPTATAALSAVAILGVIVSLLGLVLVGLSKLNPGPTLEIAASMSLLLLALSGALVILGLVGLMGPAAFVGIGALATLIVGMAGILTGLGALVTYAPQVQDFVDNGIPLLEKLGYGIGSFISSFGEGLSSGLPEIGTNLSLFMTNAKPFFDGLPSATGESLEGVKNLAQIILILAGANLIDSVSRFVSGSGGLESFGPQLVPFGQALVDFSDTVTGRINEKAVTAAANAGKVLVALAKEVPRSGPSVVSFFAGDNSLSSFGFNLVVFGRAICEFSNTISENGGIDQESVSAAAKAGYVMVALAKDVPRSGPSVISFFAGNNSISSFGKKLVKFGEAICEFSNTISENGGINQSAVTAAANAGSVLAALAKEVPRSGPSVVSFFAGDNSLSSFGRKLKSFGKSICEFSNTISDNGGIDQSAVTAAANAARTLLTLANEMKDADFSGFKSFKKNVGKLGETSLDKFVEAFETGGKDATSACKTMLNGITKAISSKNDSIGKAGGTLATKFAKGISDKESKAESAGKDLAKKAADGASDEKSSMVSAGKDLGSGLVQGINAKQKAVYNAAFDLGQKAVEGEMDGQESASPSKATKRAGHWFGEGLVIGIGQMASKVYSAGYDAGDTAVQAMSGAIARLSDVVDSDIDAQPTIRPVLDLSDVRSGAGAISDLFNRRQTVGVTSNVNAISSMMSRRNQNAGNAEVIEAINKLRKDVGNIDATSYTIGGITYDDGSSISEAVRSLVDAARIERRM